ncbi:MAG: phage terminase small subunit P27 family [Planctomycetota bacterium]|jgi:P27 family predicted phage terminase small subunit
MAKPGRKSKPTRLKLLRGNPGKRAINKKEPKPELVQNIKCPAWFGKIAKAEWNRITPELQQLKLLTAIDMKGLEAYCLTYQEYVESERVLAKEGRVYETVAKNGEQAFRARPEVMISQKARQLLKGFLAEFGMSPSSRSGVSTSDDSDKDNATAKLLFGPRD